MKTTIQTCMLIASFLFFVSLTRIQAQATNATQQGYNDAVKANPTADQDIKVVSDYLNALVAPDFDKVRSLLAPNYKGRGPGPFDSATAEDVIKTWQSNDSSQTNRKIGSIPATFRVLSGDYQGNWVAMWGEYDCTINGKDLKIPFQYTAHITNSKIDNDITYYDRLYIFQSLGFTLTPPKDN